MTKARDDAKKNRRMEYIKALIKAGKVRNDYEFLAGR